MLIQMHVYVPIETAKPELTEAVEEKQSQILGRLLKKSLHRNQETLQQVRRMCMMLGQHVTCPQLITNIIFALQLENEKALSLSYKKRIDDLTALLAIRSRKDT